MPTRDITRICQHCNKEFRLRRPWNQRFCSRRCVNLARVKIPIEQRFSKFTIKTDRCWNWTGKRNRRSYGCISISTDGQKRTVIASRLAWELYCGPIPQGLFVCHHCDNPACVNPAHLFIGTQKDNLQDASRKGRLKNLPHAKGMQTANAVLKDSDIIEIRSKAAAGVLRTDLARKFHVYRQTIYRIVNRSTWKHID